MALTVKLSYTPTSPKVGNTISVNATPTGAASGSTMSYSWTINGTAQSGTGSGITITPAQAETDVVAVTATATASDTTTETATDSVSIVTVNNTFPTIAVVVTSSKAAAIVGDAITYTAHYSPKTTGSSFSYVWYENGVAVPGETAVTFTKTYATTGTDVVKADVVLTMAGYDSSTTTSNSISMVVSEPEYDTADVNYYHPLPQRDSVFLRVGWWVMDEIQQAVTDGVDWTEPTGTSLKYQKDLLTVAKIINDFPNVAVQESRNGWILDKARIQSGKIYFW